MREWEDFSRVGIWNRTFSWTIKCGEEVDEEGYEANARAVRGWDIEAETSGKETPCHVWEGEQQEISAAKCLSIHKTASKDADERCARVNKATYVDRPNGGKGKGKVDETETKGRKKCRSRGVPGVDEDGGGIECHNVDSAHLSSVREDIRDLQQG